MRKLVSFIKGLLLYGFLSVASFLSIFPFYWMIAGATNKTVDITKGKLTLGDQLFVKFKNLVETADLPTAFSNSAKVAILATVLSMIFASMTAFGFEMYKSKTKERIFSILLLTMMVPFAALMSPLFKLMSTFGLLNKLSAVILPAIVTMFLVFFFRQNFKSFPKEIIQAARVDGAKEIEIFFKIVMPAAKSTYAAAGILAFMTNWNNFLWPLIALKKKSVQTMPMLISSLSSAYTPDFGMIMVAIVIGTLPMVIIFFTLQKYFVKGMTGAVK